MCCIVYTKGQLAFLAIIISGFISRILALQTFELRNIEDRSLGQNVDQYTNEIDSAPLMIVRSPPGYSVFDIIQLAQNERVAFSSVPANFKPNVPLLAPPKRSPSQQSAYNKPDGTIFSKRACEETSRWERVASPVSNYQNKQVDLYPNQEFWVTRCRSSSTTTSMPGLQPCYGVQGDAIQASCVETKGWVLAYSRLNSDPNGEYFWTYIPLPNCCVCKIQELPDATGSLQFGPPRVVNQPE